LIVTEPFNAVGNTPLILLREPKLEQISLFQKCENFNPTGSVKDRASFHVLNKGLERGIINPNTTIIESSSGNFGISLSSYCRKMNLKCEIVIDPDILAVNEYLITSQASKVIKVTERDEGGGYLLTRIGLVRSLIENNSSYYWTCQYGNPLVAEAYYESLGSEICDDLAVDYVFLGVSSGGTITGVSQRVKERYPNAAVVAVDVEGSVVFGGRPHKRKIPGIGSSKRPEILSEARIDDVVVVGELDTICACRTYTKRHGTLIGGSSGSVYLAVHKYFQGKTFLKKPNVAVVFADSGERYTNTVYNDEWVAENFETEKKELASRIAEFWMN